MMTQTHVDNDTGTLFPPKMLRPAIFRHYAPPADSIDLAGDEVVFHTMVSSFSDPDGTIAGELVRWVDDRGEVGYETRINGVEDNGGVSDICAFSIEMIAAIARVANDLRYEWELITGVYADQEWTYNFVSRYPNAWYPNV
jgi:hypothetical protein